MAWGGSKKAKQKQADPQSVPTPSTRSGASHTPTIIGDGALIKGRIDCSENLTISGAINGEVHCEQLINVAGSGKIEGKIYCREIVIAGIVEGDINADEQVTITETGRLIGDITTRKFSNEPGGFFEGYSHMAQDKRSADSQSGKDATDSRSGKQMEKEGNKV